MSTTEQELLEKILSELKKISTLLAVESRQRPVVVHNHKTEKVDPRLYGWSDKP